MLLMRTAIVTVCLFSYALSSTFSRQPSPSSKHHLQRPFLKMPASTEDSSVLRELKETIQKQSKEIEKLKNELSINQKAQAEPTAGGGHGAPVDVTQEELVAYSTRPFYQIAYKRMGWLGLFLVSLSTTAVIMNGFEHTLEKQIELAYFVPLLAGHGGNTGGQAVGTILSAMSAGIVTLKDAPRMIAKEAMSGLLAGAILGAIVGPVAHYTMGISLHVSTVILITLPLVSSIASTLGCAIPFACVAAGLDASVIAAPAMTSFVDVTGLLAYFMIAQQVFSTFGVEL